MKSSKECKFICDFDGKILSFDKNCEQMFGFLKNDIVNLKRIYNLLHSDFIINFLEKFDKIKKSKLRIIKYHSIIINNFNGYFNGLIFLRKFNNFFIVKIFINNNLFYNETKIINFIKKINLVIRSKFILGSIMPFFFSFFWSFGKFDEHSLFSLIFLFLGLVFFHIIANTFNDYFDWQSGRDKLNVDYMLFNTGGSRSLDFKFISERKLLFLSTICLLVVIFCGFVLFYIRNIYILFLGIIGIFCVYFYSAPPIHLASRNGFGELMHIFCLGPLITYGSILVLTGSVYLKDFCIGFPFGFLITVCLILNEVPDYKFDKISGKNNLAVSVGIKFVPYFVFFLLSFSVISVLFCIVFFNLSFIYMCFLFLLPYVIVRFNFFLKISIDRFFVLKSCMTGSYIYLSFSFLMIFSALFDFFYPW